MKKIAIVVIKGGLGNQLFQLVFCNYLKIPQPMVYQQKN